MKISNELKVGILAILAISGLIFGFNYLKGKDVFTSTPKIHAMFKDVGTLEKSNFVKVNGLTVGTVYSIEPADPNMQNIIVTISLSKNVNIPSDSKAYIEGSLLGSPTVVIEKGTANTYLKDGDTLATRIDAGLLGSLQAEVKPLVGKAKNVADTLNMLMGNVNDLMSINTKRDIQQAIAHLNNITKELDLVMKSATQSLNASMSNFESITSNIKNNNQNINSILGNFKTLSDSLKSLDLQYTLNNLNSTIAGLKSTLGQVSNPEGSLGALMNDKQLYNRLNNVALSAEILLDDLRTHPKRYVNISVFGKKNKSGALTSPAIKDTIPK